MPVGTAFTKQMLPEPRLPQGSFSDFFPEEGPAFACSVSYLFHK